MSLWKYIDGYEGLYMVSDEGEVISLPRKVDNGWGEYERDGRTLSCGLRGREKLKYKFVVLVKNGKEKHKSIHRLVAEAFIPNPDNLPEVNHKDRNTFNNFVENLEWCDKQYNIEYSKNVRVAQYLNGEKIAEYKSVKYASQMTGIIPTAISNTLKGRSKTAGGYEWKYCNKGEGGDDLSH